MFGITVLFLFYSLFAWIAGAKPHKSDHEKLPTITLPWGTYQGSLYNEDKEIYHFKNIRFGKAPVGDLRFAAPQYPDAVSDNKKIVDNSYGPNCIQAKAKKNVTIEPIADGTQSEDCLFLDVYVPAWALEEEEVSLPVIVWIYGGAYIFGGKSTNLKLGSQQFSAYDGKGIMDASNQEVIWVVGNYRLGAYGFLAGNTMEKHGQPNAGLHDQRLLLDWVQRYIEQIRGDKNSVNVWGLSAGGGSILHHLTAYGGEANKHEHQLFQRAAVWSPAFQWAYDRNGAVEETFMNFTHESKCERSSSTAIECLRKLGKDSDVLRAANQKIVSQNIELGMFPFGPAVDNDLVPDLPAVLLNEGKHVNCSSMILSHDWDEASAFLAEWVDSKQDFTQFLSYAFPGDKLTDIRNEIEEQYPPKLFDRDQKRRMKQILRDSTFVCNKHQLFSAYKDTSDVYAARYEVYPSQHGVDLLPIIWNHLLKPSELLESILPNLPDGFTNVLDPLWRGIAVPYQKYFASHAMHGDPNTAHGTHLDWPKATEGDNGIENSLRVGLHYSNPRHYFYNVGSDAQSSRENCEFWNGIAKKISVAMGDGKKGRGRTPWEEMALQIQRGDL